ncbi:MAG: DUF4914 family protein, partial [Kiritimatiellae bacterium]|nr:DUF4914 family protein [Kiritimatiellia bacterium]
EDRFHESFGLLEEETYRWLESQDLAVFAFQIGHPSLKRDALAVCPANAGFFAFGLALIQGIIPLRGRSAPLDPALIIYVAPPFRHTRFNGRQMVVHKRGDRHEIFSYNLYPGPSAKKGVYGALIEMGEQEGWITAHCSAVQAVTPYDNIVTFMHEGASGGGKSEMLQPPHRVADGRLLLGHNLVSGEKQYLEIPRTCDLRPICDDMGLCHPDFQKQDGKLYITDAENAWFVRVDHINEYGTDNELEHLTIHPPRELLFLNIETVPGETALIWNHMKDAPDKRCPNPRVILPRNLVENVVSDAVAVDIRSFGIRTPPCTAKAPSYGILGLFHILPPALAWLWRLVSPRGYANPSIVSSEAMSSEGVGSYWPFATGRRVVQANLLLEQFRQSPSTRYILVPNQHIGSWKTGFMPEWLVRDYLARRGHARYPSDQVTPSRCPLLGYSLQNIRIEGRTIPRSFLQVDQQPEVGVEAYDAGAAMLREFFHQELRQYLQPELDPMGRAIIETCLTNGTAEDYRAFIPEDDV